LKKIKNSIVLFIKYRYILANRAEQKKVNWQMLDKRNLDPKPKILGRS
jgi:hypothetical protein